MKIDLSKHKVGDKFVTRDGGTATLHKAYASGHFPYIISHDDGSCSVNKSGLVYGSHEPCLKDIMQPFTPEELNQEIFDMMPDGLTEFVYKGQRYKKEVITKWVKVGT